MILKNKFILSTVLLSGLCVASHAIAAPTISSPYVSKGETAVEAKGEFKSDDDENDSWGTELSVGHGFTSFGKRK